MSEAFGGFTGDGTRFLANVRGIRIVPAVRTTRAKMHTDPAYLRYMAMKDELKMLFLSLVNASGGSPFLKSDPLVVHITVGKLKGAGKFGVQACDIDNLAKSVLDSMTGVVFHDDRDVQELHIRKTGVMSEGREYVIVNVIKGVQYVEG